MLNLNTKNLVQNSFSRVEDPSIDPATETYRFIHDSVFELEIGLDSEIQIAERVVKDAVTLFGDIGGFSGFFTTLLGLLVGSIPTKLFHMNLT